MKKYSIDDVCFFDTETTGVPPRGANWENDYMDFPFVVQLAWSVGDKQRSEIILPEGWEIPEAVAAIHGITTERAMAEGKPFEEVISEFLDDAFNAPLVCAHNIYFDTSIIKAGILRKFGTGVVFDKAEIALYKGKRIDTMNKTVRFVGARFANGRPGKYPKLEELYAKLFDGETFPAHDAFEDVKALKRCLPPLVEMGLIVLEPKQYEAAQPPTVKIEVEDTAPIELPKATGMNKAAELLNQNDF